MHMSICIYVLYICIDIHIDHGICHTLTIYQQCVPLQKKMGFMVHPSENCKSYKDQIGRNGYPEQWICMCFQLCINHI